MRRFPVCSARTSSSTKTTTRSRWTSSRAPMLPQRSDCSSTTAPAWSSKRERVVAAATKFAELSNPADEVFVLAFNENVRPAWGPRLLSESDLEELRATLGRKIAARGQTALYDAIPTGLELLVGRPPQPGRCWSSSAMDGTPPAAQPRTDRSPAGVVASAMIYSVALFRTAVDRDGNPRLLTPLVRCHGRRSVRPDRPDKVAVGARAHRPRHPRHIHHRLRADQSQSRRLDAQIARRREASGRASAESSDAKRVSIGGAGVGAQPGGLTVRARSRLSSGSSDCWWSWASSASPGGRR